MKKMFLLFLIISSPLICAKKDGKAYRDILMAVKGVCDGDRIGKMYTRSYDQSEKFFAAFIEETAQRLNKDQKVILRRVVAFAEEALALFRDMIETGEITQERIISYTVARQAVEKDLEAFQLALQELAEDPEIVKSFRVFYLSNMGLLEGMIKKTSDCLQ